MRNVVKSDVRQEVLESWNNYRIAELTRLEEAFEVIKSNL